MAIINESGFLRASKLLDAGGKDKDLSLLIKDVADQETDWLEVKANPFMPPRDDPFYVEGENEDYYEWTNLIKPLIAMANFHGGVLLLGLKEEGGKFQAVDLKNRNNSKVEDEEKGFDNFTRELEECFSKTRFTVVKKKNETTYKIDHPLRDLVVQKRACYQGHLVLAVLVQVSQRCIGVCKTSCDCRSEFISLPNEKIVKNERSSSEELIYYARCSGETGRTREYKTEYDLRSYRECNIGAACRENIRNYYGSIMLKDADALVGRVDECNAVSKILDQGKSPLITGGAGIGKTSVAIKLAQKWVGGCAQGCVVVNVNAEKMEKLEEAFFSGDFRRLIESQTEGFQWQNRNDATEVCKDVLSWLKLYGIKCLVIYENVEDVRLLAPSEISRFCGYDGADHVSFCFVSRRHGALRNTGMVEPYELPDLSEKDALELLERRNPFQDAEEKSAALEIVRLPEVAGYRAWVLDIISARMASDEVPSYRYVLKGLKRDLSGTIVAAGEDGDVMTPSMREGKSTVQKLLEPSLTIFDKKPKSLDLLLLSLFFPPDRFGRAEIAELYRSVFGVPPEEDGEDWAHEFGEMIRPMLDRHIWLRSGNGFAMHRLTAEGVRGKYGKELSEVWARLSAYLEKYVTVKIDLRRIPTVLSILRAAAGMGFADDVKRLCLDTENLADSHFLSRAIEFCSISIDKDKDDLEGLIDSFRSDDSVAAMYMCAQYDVARNCTELRPVEDALMNIVDERRSDDGTDASTWHYVALAYQLLGDIFLYKLSEQCAFSCYCQAVEIMCGRLKMNSHPDVLRGVCRLYDVGRRCHHWNEETSKRVVEMSENLGASLALAFRYRTEGDYEYALLSDENELQLHADLAEMDDEDGSGAVRAFVKARLSIALRWYQKCAEVLGEVGVGATPCFLVECYMAELHDHANSVLCKYGGAEDLRQESVRRFEGIVDKYGLADSSDFKEFCQGGGSAVEDDGGNVRFLCKRLLKYVQRVRDCETPEYPDSIDRLFDRLSVNSRDVANSYWYVEENYFGTYSLARRMPDRFLPYRYQMALDNAVDLAERQAVADRLLQLLSLFLNKSDFECPAACEVLGVSVQELQSVCQNLEALCVDAEELFIRLVKSYDVKGREEKALALVSGMIQLWASKGLDERWRRDMATLGEIYYSRQDYKESLRIYDEINRKTGRESDAGRYAFERCRCCELMNDGDAVRRIIQGSQDGTEYYRLLADMVELCSKHGLPRLEWYVKQMIELGASKVEAIWAVLRETGGSTVRDDGKGAGTVSGRVVQLCEDVSHFCEAVSCLYAKLKSYAALHERMGERGLSTRDKFEAGRLAKLAIDLCTVKIEVHRASLRAAGGFVVRNGKTGEETETEDVACLYKELKNRAELYEKIGAKELCAKDTADAEKLATEVRERLPGRLMIWMIDGL